MTPVSELPVERALPYRPPAELAGLVTGVAYEQRGYPAGQHTGLPSHHVTFIVPIEEPLAIRRTANGDPAERSFETCVGGLHTAPVTIAHAGRQVGFHLSLSPRGARALLGVPAAALAAELVDVDELWGGLGRELVERVNGVPDWPSRVAVVDDVLRRRLAAAPARAAAGAEVTEAWRALTVGRAARVTDVADHVGWSRRHLSERFAAEYGVTPKTLARIVRFERAADRLKRPDRPALATVAAEVGFADQAHMTRDWHDFAGCSPRAWLAAEVLPFVQDDAAGRDREWAA